MTPRSGWRSVTCLCLLVGALFRFIWIDDAEYKNDEDQMFHYSQAIPATQLWPAIGTSSGVREVRHPPLGNWSFAILAQAFHLQTPVAVTRSASALSLAALALLFWFAWRVVPAPERDIWLWTAALASVNLVATVYARKIWIPSLLPIFSVVLLIAWSYRHTRVGALIWGIDGALIGQVHMTGFFYAAAMLIITAAFGRTSVRWRAWLAGSAWGTIPAFSWLYYLWMNVPTLQAHASTLAVTSLNLDFFRMAFEIALSQTADVNLGGDFREYLRYPVFLGASTHGVWVAQLALDTIGAITIVIAAAAMLRQLRAFAHRCFSDTHLCLFIAVVTGAALSVAGVPNLPNHHLMVFPLEYLWIPMAVLAYLPKPRLWLTLIWLGSAVCTFGFLQFIHVQCGAPNGDYGVAYRCQRDGDASAPRSPDLVALIRPGNEDLLAGMLGRGELLPGSCSLTAGQIDHNLVRGTYACGEGRVALHLAHRNNAPDDAPRTRNFAVVLVEGSPPDGFLKAIVENVRRDEARFEWALEAGPGTSAAGEASGLWPHDNSPPALPAREVLRRIIAGTVILLLSFPWWGATRARAA